jgi:fibrillarin-like pre-rRNA processing protein
MNKRYNKSSWNPYRSKWKAALEKNLIPNLEGNENILYLGASTGSTISHLCKKTTGTIFAVEKSATMAIPLVKLAQKATNIAPIFADALSIDYIKTQMHQITPQILFQDIPSRDQIKLLTKASTLVDKNCKIYLSLKTQSISQRSQEKTLEYAKLALRKNFKIENCDTLEPFHKKHYFFILSKK